jgi:hypothetical protein
MLTMNLQRPKLSSLAFSILENLIILHAHFPFSSLTPLKKDSFCRAILILSDRCGVSFKEAIIINRDYVVSKRTNRKRLRFIYSALARPLAGKCILYLSYAECEFKTEC